MPEYNPRWGRWQTEPPAIAPAEIVKELSCDVLVLGAGIAGVSCALRAAQNGLKVIVMEKTRNWSARGGNIGVASSTYMKSRGYENDLEAMAREWIKRCANRCDEELLWLFLRNSGSAMDWLLDIVTSPEYGARPELQACLYQGDTYYERMGSHRIFDGPMAKKGLRPGAADAVYAMYNEALKLGAEYIFSCPAVRLIKEDGRVAAAIGQSEDGYIRVNAAKGVVIATGDIGGNRDMCEDLAPLANRCAKNIYTPKGGNEGDGHRLGYWAGGAFEDGPFPIIIHPQAYFMGNYCFLFVDHNGNRFMNEDNYIQGKNMAMLRRGMTYAWSIIDSDWPTKIPASFEYGGGIFWDIDRAPDENVFQVEVIEKMLENGLESGLAIKADTLEALAEKIGVPAANFVESVTRINEYAAKGVDEQFGKRKELLFSIDKAPYYALKFGPAALAVVGGLKVNTRMNVTNAQGSEIPGLYAIGNAAGGRYGVDYPMVIPGSSHGTALTFGYLLGDILAK